MDALLFFLVGVLLIIIDNLAKRRLTIAEVGGVVLITLALTHFV